MKQILAKMERAAMSCAIVCLIAFVMVGCGTRTIYVRDGEPVRLRQEVKKVKIWAADKNGKEVPGTMDLPEGWYALPDPK